MTGDDARGARGMRRERAGRGGRSAAAARHLLGRRLGVGIARLMGKTRAWGVGAEALPRPVGELADAWAGAGGRQ